MLKLKIWITVNKPYWQPCRIEAGNGAKIKLSKTMNESILNQKNVNVRCTRLGYTFKPKDIDSKVKAIITLSEVTWDNGIHTINTKKDILISSNLN
jgi:hypothetical protein